MEDNNWHEDIEKEIGSLKEKMTKGDYKLFEVDLLLRVAKRVTSFSSDCEYCQSHRNDISNLVTDLGNLPKMTEEEVADYGRTFRSIIKHLEKHHGLRRSVPNPFIPLGIALVVILISLIAVVSAETMADTTELAIFYIGCLIAAILLIVGVVQGILRLSRKPI